MCAWSGGDVYLDEAEQTGSSRGQPEYSTQLPSGGSKDEKGGGGALRLGVVALERAGAHLVGV